MRKIRGFRIGRKFVKVFKWVVHRSKKARTRQFLNSPSCTDKAVAKICSWGRSMKRCFLKPNSGYLRLGDDPGRSQPLSVPKGHLPVYVGEKEDDAHRILVPVIYLAHPLFEELLREAEKVYGFDHPGGIQIPCRMSEFENVQTKIAATGGGSCHSRRSRRRL
ncbi:hypothetical protein RJ639_026862 [Escallonia herrerae]|uniref:Small auxin up regulated protein n=1 Tax=Escallonia herrerae TaxID=1293975 RepID=A0AA88XET0_9ASTE|nr:hypothetical protein RJ639_026862 [Escallonia herrerae]